MTGAGAEKDRVWMGENVVNVIPGVLTLSSGVGHRAEEVRMNTLPARLSPCDTSPLQLLVVTIGAQESYFLLYSGRCSGQAWTS